MSKPKGQHGGKREGAGRKAGSRNTLGYGEVKALRSLRYRLKEGTPPEMAAAAGIALDRIVDVMMERVPPTAAPSVLKAATLLREEACGPIAQKHEVAGPEGGALVVKVVTLECEDA